MTVTIIGGYYSGNYQHGVLLGTTSNSVVDGAEIRGNNRGAAGRPGYS